MPELPEVETMRRAVEPAVGSRITALWRPRSRLQPIAISPRLSDFRRRAVGRRIVSVERLGKRVVARLDGAGDSIVFEPRMSGLLLLADPPNEEHLRLVFELAGKRPRQLLFWNRRGLGVVRLLSPRRLAQELGPHRLGLDALAISMEELRRRLQLSRRAVKVALMDQRTIAGIGNLYASEIVHRIGLHPETPCNRLRPDDFVRLHAAIVEVLEEAIVHQGSTLGDGTYRINRNRTGAYQLLHRVYQRAGQPCVHCGNGEIVRIVQAQRSTFFCPKCQPKRRRR